MIFSMFWLDYTVKRSFLYADGVQYAGIRGIYTDGEILNSMFLPLIEKKSHKA